VSAPPDGGAGSLNAPDRQRPSAHGVRIVGALAAVTAVSQFYRASNGAIAPELVRDLGLTPGMLGVANGAFFVAIGVAQVPVGMAFDRFGARRTVTALSTLAVMGALLHAAVGSAAGLVVARLLVGLGCSGSFMGAVVVCSRWFAGPRFTTLLSRVFALSNAGTLAAATPLAAAAVHLGWRGAFLASAAVTAAVAVLFFASVRDAPEADAPGRPERLAEVLRGVVEVWRTPGLLPVLAMHTFAYASMLTVLGLWAGPYLNDVHGLDPVGRGNVLLAMGAAQVAGVLVYGPLDRVLGTRKRVVVTGASLNVLVLAALALVPAPPVAWAVGLLVALCFVTSYGIQVVAHGRSLFPAHLAGRGVTTVNLAQVVGSFSLPMITGAVVGAFPREGGASPEAAYRTAFGVIAAAVALGLAGYSRARDSRPPGKTGRAGRHRV
jgi:predicted MFS family arabinose efflux permease